MVNKAQDSIVWPSQLIVGASKSGITSLFEYLNGGIWPQHNSQFIKDHPRLRVTISKLLSLSFRAALRNRYTMRPGTKPPIDQRAVSFQSKIYTPEIEALEELMGHNLPCLNGNL